MSPTEWKQQQQKNARQPDIFHKILSVTQVDAARVVTLEARVK